MAREIILAAEKLKRISDTLAKIDEVVTALAAFGDVTGIQSSINTINTKLSTVADNANNYVHPATHPVSIINGVGYPSKFVKTDASGNTGFDAVLWSDLQNKPSSFTPAAHEHDMSVITSGNLEASRVNESSLRQFVTALEKAQFLTMESTDNKGQAGGYAPLGSDGKIPSGYLSQLDVLDVWNASDQATMLALSSAGRGDFCIRSDYPSGSAYPTYQLRQLPASTLSNWVGINSGTGVNAVNGKIGVVTLTSDDIGEGASNLYFTTPRVVTAVRNLLASGTNNVSLTYNSVSGTLSISVDGYTKSEVAALIANAEDTLGSSITSAATITIGTAGLGDSMHITGTTAITSLGTAAQAGVRRTLVFDGALTLTHSSSLICPGAVSITTVAGMAIEVIAESTSVWRIVKVQHPSVTVAQLGFLAGLTSDAQTQINAKSAKSGKSCVRAIKNSQTISALTWTKAALNVKIYDVAADFDAITNYRYQPTKAGYYALSAILGLGSSKSGCLSFYKNGAGYSQGSYPTQEDALIVEHSDTVYLNGTDYIEVYVYSTGTIATTTFNAFLIQEA